MLRGLLQLRQAAAELGLLSCGTAFTHVPRGSINDAAMVACQASAAYSSSSASRGKDAPFRTIHVSPQASTAPQQQAQDSSDEAEQRQQTPMPQLDALDNFIAQYRIMRKTFRVDGTPKGAPSTPWKPRLAMRHQMALYPTVARPVAPQARRGSSVDDFNALESAVAEMYVRAYMIGEDLDLPAIAGDMELRDKYKVRLCADHLVLYQQEEYGSKAHDKPPVRVAAVVYKFGAAVLFDVSADHTVEADPLLVLLREHKGKAAPDWRSAQAQATASQAGGQPLHMEDADLIRFDSLSAGCAIDQHPNTGAFLLAQLDVGAMRVVSKVLAQSVALRHYHDKASHNMAEFNELLEDMSRTGDSARMPNKELVRFIATNTHLDHSVLQNLGLMNISDIAWNDTAYNQIWDMCRKEYEIEARYESLSTLLTAANDTAKFTLSLRQFEATKNAEHWIIRLICIEIFLTLAGYSVDLYQWYAPAGM